jgi:CheY-specific phosphatase CheX
MLAMSLDPLKFPHEFCVGPGHVAARVCITGAWNGSIEVRMAEGSAFLATAAMLMQPSETVGAADALDATKETANMIAGIIKSSLPRPCNMTVPESCTTEHSFCRVARTADPLVVGFRHETGELMLHVAEDAESAQ